MNIMYNPQNHKYSIGNNEFDKEKFIRFIETDMLQNYLSKESGNIFTVDYTQDEAIPQEIDNTLKNGKNILYYGAPGTGKSREVEDLYAKDKSYVRAVFHSEYSYYDFIGTYKPYTNDEGKIEYKFRPGPLAIALLNAFNDEKRMHSLIIEEISRGDASAIFGEFFQLLDRDEKGRSEYKIDLDIELHKFFKENIMSNNKDIQKEIIEKGKIYIPSNLNLIGTMNSSDQGVNVMDTAFKRRWIYKFMPITFNDVEHKDEMLNYNGKEVTWMNFAETINKFIILSGLHEDRQIGQYFLKKGEVSDPEIFCSKLLFYLWSDVAKFNKDFFFLNGINTYVELVDYFKAGNRIFSRSIDVGLLGQDKDNSEVNESIGE